MPVELYNYIEPTGIIVTDTSEVLSEVQQEWQNALGADLIVTPDTPQGVMITAESLNRSAAANNDAQMANQINPNLAGGIMLDAILALTGVKRTSQTQTTVKNVTVTGVVGTIIPAASVAATAAGDQFTTDGAITIPNGGTTTVNFTSVMYGPIPAAQDALNTIGANGAIGWETVDNGSSSVTTLGATTQSDQAARAYRNNTLAFNGISLAEAITSALYAVAGVTSLTFQENVAATTQTINGISMVSHSVYACVDGGTDLDVASALLENKSSGAAWNGGTTVDVIEPASGQVYAVKFDRPAGIGILIKVTSPNGNATNISNAILAYAAGQLNGFTGFIVGADVTTYDIGGAILSLYPSYIITNLQIALAPSGSYQNSPIAIAVNQIAQTQLSYITVESS